jgi:sugar phosphate isomerase/epimerase
MNAKLVKCLCGISDEAGSALDAQVEAHRELGWELIELRTIDGARLVDLPRQDLARVKSTLRAEGLKVAAIDTGIGGWGRSVLTPFGLDMEELKRAAECADLLGTRFLRIMSFPNDGLTPDGWRDVALERIAGLVEAARAVDLVLLHENCQGWASQGPCQTLDMLRQIDSPHLRLLFDIGNPVAYGQDGLSFINAVAPWVEHVHIKDASLSADGEVMYMPPGEGDAHVALCIDVLFRHGYRGAFSIEPHRAYVPHLGAAADGVARRQSYMAYGRRFQALLEDVVSPHRNLL